MSNFGYKLRPYFQTYSKEMNFISNAFPSNPALKSSVYIDFIAIYMNKYFLNQTKLMN